MSMKIFNRKKSDQGNQNTDPPSDTGQDCTVPETVPDSQKETFHKWSQAKVITAEKAAPGNLTPGWYVWVQHGDYYALKPNDANTGLTASPRLTNLDDLKKWIEISLPQDFVLGEYIREKLAGQPTQKYNSAEPIDDLENQQNTVPQGPLSLTSRIPNRRRSNEVHIRFTDEEYQCMQDRAAVSCLPMSIFMRQAILTGEIKADPHRDIFIQEVRDLNAELRRLRGDCGKLGGLLKKAIKPNEEQASMNPEEWEDLIHNIHALFSLQRVIEKTMVKINGRLSDELQ